MTNHPPPAPLRRIFTVRVAVARLAAVAMALASLVGPSAAWAEHRTPPSRTQNGDYIVYVYPEAHFSEESDIRKMLASWASAAARNNVDSESRFYAPQLDRYFLRRNVSNDFVRRDKQALRNRGYELQSFAINNVNIELSSDTDASVTLVKSWVLARSDGSQRTSSTRSHLTLRRNSSGWKITGEQDLKPVQSAAGVPSSPHPRG